MQPITIYTDGASRGNPGPGGYGIVLIWGKHRKEMSEGYKLTTNNRMELLSVIKALEAIKQPGHEIQVYSDSKYVVDAFNQNWILGWIKKGFKDLKNTDLWKQLIPLTQKHKVKFFWVKGHNGHPENERCDKLAVAAALSTNLLTDFGYIQSQKV